MNLPIPILKQCDIERFWTKVAITANEEKCWEWTAGKRRRGYGQFSLSLSVNIDRGFVATRVSYFISNGADPREMVVCHSCDNTSCVNPKHLFLGTNKDNTMDMMKKGRGIQPLGSNSGRSKLKEADVLKIRQLHASGLSQKAIGRQYNVDGSAICNIIRKRNWGWLV